MIGPVAVAIRHPCLAVTSIHQPADGDGQLLNATSTGTRAMGAKVGAT
jgi:hypothetical protein